MTGPRPSLEHAQKPVQKPVQKPLQQRARKTPEPADLGDPRLGALIAAAEDIFLSKGYHTATMSDVAKAAGISKKTIYSIIKSKGELFAALLAHRHAMLKFPAPTPGADIRDILYAHVLCFARFLLSPRQIAILRLIMAEYTHSPDLARVFHRKQVDKAKSKLETCLIGLPLSEHYKNADPKELAAMLFGMAIGEFHAGALIGFRPIPSKAALEKRVRQAVDIFLAGCKASG